MDPPPGEPGGGHALVALLGAHDGDTAALEAALAELAAGLAAVGARGCYAGRAIVGNPLDEDGYGVGTSDFDVAFEARFDPAVTSPDALAAALARLRGRFDPARSVAVAGPRRVVVHDEADLHVHYLLVRRPGTTTGDFRRAWIDDFAPIVRETPTQRGYRQLLVDHVLALDDGEADPGRSPGATGPAPDGIACGYFVDGASLAASSRWAHARPDHRATLERFVDLGRTRSILSRTI